ncbi:MAG TPA: hypothetical protein VG346_04295 [Acidimicrobiales bacterium]|nr:hypothetical protein [Acidimicrobiales bacterium]
MSESLPPIVDVLRRNGLTDFVGVGQDECGPFAAVAEITLTRASVATPGLYVGRLVHPAPPGNALAPRSPQRARREVPA